MLLREIAKRREKETQIVTAYKFFMKTQMSNKQNLSYDIIIIETLVFELKGIRWDLSMMRISYKLTKRTKKNCKV